MSKGKRKILKGGTIVLPDRTVKGSLVIEDGVISGIVTTGALSGYEEIDVSGKVLLPGVIDTHVHMWDPGPGNYREDWYHGTRCAASGGITTVVEMPLSVPPVTNKANFQGKYDTASKNACVDFALWGGLTPECVERLPELNELGCAAFKGFISFANPDYPQVTDGYLVRAMQIAKQFDGLIGVHAENAEIADFGSRLMDETNCEDESMHDDARPWWVELEAIQRAVLFAKVHDVRLLICHLSSSEGAEFVKKAKCEGVKVFLETCPHYLLFDKNVLREKKAYAKCNPPFRSRESVEKLWEYMFDGTVDVMGSDHGPYSDEEKVQEGSFWKELCGFGGYDAMLAGLLDEGVIKRGLPLPRLSQIMSGNAAKIMGLFPKKGSLLPGSDADVAVVDMDRTWVYDGAKSFSKTKSVKGIYQGREMRGKVAMTLVRGEVVYDGENIKAEPGYGRFVPRERV